MRNFICLILILFAFMAKAATVDSLDVTSAVMNKTYKAAVV